jgi:hypothetical protein
MFKNKIGTLYIEYDFLYILSSNTNPNFGCFLLYIHCKSCWKGLIKSHLMKPFCELGSLDDWTLVDKKRKCFLGLRWQIKYSSCHPKEYVCLSGPAVTPKCKNWHERTGANPTIVSYNPGAVKIHNATRR